jgi:hypothetical protein
VTEFVVVSMKKEEMEGSGESQVYKGSSSLGQGLALQPSLILYGFSPMTDALGFFGGDGRIGGLRVWYQAVERIFDL